MAASLACTDFSLYLCSLFPPRLTTLHTAATTTKEVHGSRGFFECLDDFKFALPEYMHLGIIHKGKNIKPSLSGF